MATLEGTESREDLVEAIRFYWDGRYVADINQCLDALLSTTS